MLQTIKELPIVLNVRKQVFEKKFATHKNVNYFRGVFENFEEAYRSSPPTKHQGYDNLDSARLYKERIERIYSTDYPVLFWMKHFQNQYKTVFDFGGHVGIHFYSYSKVLDYKNIESWTVCDVESVIKEGKKIKDEKNATKLRFANDISSSDGHDLFLASGSLQYLEWELHDTLKEMRKPPEFLIINMLPLHPEFKTITLQSIGTSFCPYYIRKESEFIHGIQSVGYKLIDSWNNEEKKCNIAFEADRSLTFYRGMIFQKI